MLRIVPILFVAILASSALLVHAAPVAPAQRLDATDAPSCDPVPGSWDILVDALPALEGGEDTHLCYGKIRPGARMTAPVGCTFNWIVRDSAGDLYIGSAGHCTGVGSRVATEGVGEFGTVVYNGYSRGIDWLLVKVDANKLHRVDPTLCHWGGPGALGVPDLGDELLVYGFGTGYGTLAATRARVGVAYTKTAGEMQYVGMMQPGDSGAPVMTDEGEAVGIHVRSSLSVPVVGLRVDPSYKYATRLDFAMADASTALGTTISLVTSDVPVNLAGSPQG